MCEDMFGGFFIMLHIHVCVRAYVCVCVCVCVIIDAKMHEKSVRGRERELKRKIEKIR